MPFFILEESSKQFKLQLSNIEYDKIRYWIYSIRIKISVTATDWIVIMCKLINKHWYIEINTEISLSVIIKRKVHIKKLKKGKIRTPIFK